MDRLGNASLPGSPRAFLVFSRIKPSLFEYYSRRKVLFMFRKCSGHIPAYSRFIKDHNIEPSALRSINEFDKFVPATTKENYIKTYSLVERCMHGRLPEKGIFEESSGTTGSPILWIRSKEEEDYAMALSGASLRYLYGFGEKEKFIAINCFMMGGWSGGLRFSKIVSMLARVRNIGQDAQKAIECIRDMGNGYTYLIAGYPPFLVDLIEQGRKSGNFSWKDYRVHVFAGGEGFVEEWREFVSSQLRTGALIYSDYGAIDLDVGISVETPFSVAVRKITNNDPAIGRKIFSTDRIPCFVGQCSPQQFYVREKTDDKGIKELEITVMNLKSVSPNIKYRIGDEGGIIRFTEMSRMLEAIDYPVEKIRKDFNIDAIIPFPILYLFGRRDGTVSVNGALVSKNEIERALLSDPELVSAIGRFKFSAESDNENHIRLCVCLEARKEAIISDRFSEKCSEAVLSSLLISNECFRKGYNSNPSMNCPVVKLLPYASGIFTEQQDKIKNVYSI